MPKRKPSPEKRVWARVLGREWQINLVSGEVLKPVRELSGDAHAIAEEFEQVTDDYKLFANTASLFRGSSGTEAVALEYHH